MYSVFAFLPQHPSFSSWNSFILMHVAILSSLSLPYVKPLYEHTMAWTCYNLHSSFDECLGCFQVFVCFVLLFQIMQPWLFLNIGARPYGQLFSRVQVHGDEDATRECRAVFGFTPHCPVVFHLILPLSWYKLLLLPTLTIWAVRLLNFF